MVSNNMIYLITLLHFLVLFASGVLLPPGILWNMETYLRFELLGQLCMEQSHFWGERLQRNNLAVVVPSHSYFI